MDVKVSEPSLPVLLAVAASLAIVDVLVDIASFIGRLFRELAAPIVLVARFAVGMVSGFSPMGSGSHD